MSLDRTNFDMYLVSILPFPPPPVKYCWRYCNPNFEKWKNAKSVLVPMLRQGKLTVYSTASHIQLNHSFSVNHYFSFRIKQEMPIVRIVISLFVSILFHFTLMLLKLENALITADLLNQNPTKNVMLLYKNCFN